MKQTSLAVLILLTLSVLVLSGCQGIYHPQDNYNQPSQNNLISDNNTNISQTQEFSCDELSQKLDTTQIYVNDCQNMEKSNTPVKNMVGGTLLDINKTYEDGYNQYWYTLTFQGKNAPKQIHVIAKTELDFNNRNIQIGKFYEFDMSGICRNIMSAANSGSFSGDFKEKECN